MATSYSPKIITDGLVLCLDAGDGKSYSGSGTTWTDRSGGGNDATLLNGVGYSDNNNGLLTLDGVNDYLNCFDDADVFEDDNSLTVSIFVNINESSLPSRGGLVSSQRYSTESDAGGYGLCILETDRICVNLTKNIDGTQSSYHIINAVDALKQEMAQYIFTYDNSTKTVVTYINGIQKASSTNSNYGWTVNTTNRLTRIGINWQGGWGARYNMGIGSVHIYNKALTADQVLQNYNATKGRFGL